MEGMVGGQREFRPLMGHGGEFKRVLTMVFVFAAGIVISMVSGRAH